MEKGDENEKGSGNGRKGAGMKYQTFSPPAACGGGVKIRVSEFLGEWRNTANHRNLPPLPQTAENKKTRYNPPMPTPPNGNNRQQIDKARAALLGIIPDPKGQVEQITTALVYKYLDKLDSDSVAIGGRRTYFVDNTAEFSWENLLSPSLTGDQRLLLYRRAVEGMVESGKLGEVFGEMMRGASSPFQNARVLQTFLHAIDKLDCEHTENLGDAYEHLLSIMGTQGDAGQFRTPRNIIDFIVAAVAPQKNERVLDPACGSAGFLAAAHAHVMRHGGILSPADKRKLAQNIVGHDIDPGMVRLAMVNLYLHKIKSPKVREYDSLSDDSLWEERADVILANPPFMTPSGGIQPHGRFMVRANRSELLFVDYIAEHLSPQGRAGVIVPYGVIFQSGKAYKTLRKMLVEDWGLWAVASLPFGVFQPYAPGKTSVLFLDKTRRDFNNVLFVNVENDGFDSGVNRNPIDKNDLPAALKIMGGYNDEKKVKHPLALAVAKTKIAEDSDYSFVADYYREVAAFTHAKFPTVKLNEILDINFGQRITKRENSGTKYPVYGGGGESFRTDKFNRENDFVISRFAMSENCVRFVGGKFWLMDSGFTVSVKPDAKVGVEKDFVCLMLKGRQSSIFRLSRGHAQRNLEMRKFGNLLIPIPPIQEQKRVIAKAERRQRAADKYRSLADTMEEEIAQTIARIWEDKP